MRNLEKKQTKKISPLEVYESNRKMSEVGMISSVAGVATLGASSFVGAANPVAGTVLTGLGWGAIFGSLALRGTSSYKMNEALVDMNDQAMENIMERISKIEKRLENFKEAETIKEAMLYDRYKSLDLEQKL